MHALQEEEENEPAGSSRDGADRRFFSGPAINAGWQLECE